MIESDGGYALFDAADPEVASSACCSRPSPAAPSPTSPASIPPSPRSSRRSSDERRTHLAVARPTPPARTVWLVAQREMIDAPAQRRRSWSRPASCCCVLVGSVVIGARGRGERVRHRRSPSSASVELPAATPALDVTEVADQADGRAARARRRRRRGRRARLGPARRTRSSATTAPRSASSRRSASRRRSSCSTRARPAGFLGYLVAIGFGLVFFISAMTFGTTIAQTVVEEKQTRVIEILLATIPTRALLAGKILGTTILAFGQIALLLAITVIGLHRHRPERRCCSGSACRSSGSRSSSCSASCCSPRCSRRPAPWSRARRTSARPPRPVTMLVMIPYFLVIFFNDNPLVRRRSCRTCRSRRRSGCRCACSSATAQWWEPLLSLAILLATTCVAVIAIGARIYENSLLRMGQRVKLARGAPRLSVPIGAWHDERSTPNGTMSGDHDPRHLLPRLRERQLRRRPPRGARRDRRGERRPPDRLRRGRLHRPPAAR